VEERVLFARSQAVRRRRRARGFVLISFLYLRLNSCAKCWTIRLSKSSPAGYHTVGIAHHQICRIV